MADKQDPSGIDVYPRLPVPQHPPMRQSEPRVRGFPEPPTGNRRVTFGVLIGLLVGAAAGYFLAPTKADQLSKANKEIERTTVAAKTEAARATAAQKQVDVLNQDKAALEAKLAATSAKAADVDKKVAAAMSAAEQKLKDAIDKSSGSVSTEGEEIHLQLVDKVLFAVGDDQLTDKGKAVLAKVGKALTDLPDKQIWVQGHTDDTPIVVPPPPKPKKGTKPKKGAPPEPPPPGPRFASNWELSAARALQVVHYLQDTAKIDPSRLAALAFGQYRPVSKSNKALNRRIEIVLYPHKAVIEKK